MDSDRFDQLARALRHPTSRRGALDMLAGGAALAARLAGLDGADGVAARRRKAVKGPGSRQNAPKVALCHNGHTIVVAEPAVAAHLAQGDTLGPCGAPGQGTCVPNDQICSLLSPVRCCGDRTFCRPTIYPTLTTCQTACTRSPNGDAVCQEILGYPDVQCVKDVIACGGSTLGECCRPKVCGKSSDCQGGGPCCPSAAGLAGPKRCCAPGQVCATFGGCATP
jgi:hypothetical protein